MQIVRYVLACRSYSSVCTLHHIIIIIVQTYLKTLNLLNACQIYFIECVSENKQLLSVIHYTICGAVCFQFTHFPCDDWHISYSCLRCSSMTRPFVFSFWYPSILEHRVYIYIYIYICMYVCFIPFFVRRTWCKLWAIRVCIVQERYISTELKYQYKRHLRSANIINFNT